MKNPIQVFDKIKDNFILYVKTAFGTRYPAFEETRQELLQKDKIFTRSPWIEPLPIYKQSEYKINDIVNIPNLQDEELQIFKKIVNAGLISDFKIYQHQYDMLQHAMDGNHCVITSGTGSGKTESFLLPVFAYMSKELNKWRPTQNNINNTKWWFENGWGPIRIVGNGNTTLSEATRQRPTPNRPPAIRAMLIYPMNALVEDQLSRLRKALDSDDARNVFAEHYNDNRIYFGRYNSTSPISGKLYKLNDDENIIPNSFNVLKLKEELRALEKNIQELNNYITQNPDHLNNEEIKDLVANFQRLDGAEMRTRFDMHITPPDIMITNFSMLSIMLMRDIENPIFDKTKSWLECNTEFDVNLTQEQKEQEKKERIFHIIVDELHLYRGGSGSEIAYLIRMLLSRIGLTPDSNQLRILASSASVEGVEGEAFLKSFFGTEQKEINIIEGTETKPEPDDNFPLQDHIEVFERIGREIDQIDNYFTENSFENVGENIIQNLDEYLNIYLNAENQYNIINYLIENQERIKQALYFAFIVEGRTRAVPAFKNGVADTTEGVMFISEVLFGKEQEQNKEAVKGFFYVLGLFEKFRINHDYPRFRFHLFYRNIPGMWGELIPDDRINNGTAPVADILTAPEITYNGHRTLELLYCENCGTLAYGGSRIKYTDENGDPNIELIPVSPDIEGVPENSPATIVEKRKYNDFSVFCPGNYSGNAEPEFTIPNTNRLKLKWYNAWLNVYSGKIVINDPHNTASFISGKWLRIMDGDNDISVADNNTGKIISALPHTCPHCEADYSHPQKKKQSPFRGFRTGFGKVSQILSKDLFEALPMGDKTKKLIAFSDSREDAAKLAKSIEEEHYTSLLKEVIVHNMTNVLQLENRIIHSIENNDDEQAHYSALYPNLFDEFSNLILRASRGRNDAVIELNSLKANIKPLQTFVAIVIQELLKFGINPGGPYKSIENFRSGNKYKPWYFFFDFNTYNYDNTRDGWQNVRDIINTRIESNLSSLIFGRLFYSFEASGLGFATIENNNFLSDQAASAGLNIAPGLLLQVCNSFMRIWGDNYKHNRTDYTVTIYNSYQEIPQGRKEQRYIRKVTDLLNRDEIELGNAVYAVLQHNNHRGNIEINNLKIKIANREAEYYKCDHCGTIHLHQSGMVCVFCLSTLPGHPSGIVSNLWSQNYLTANLLREYQPFRLHTEELTGQTDNQLLRQRQFKNVFLNPNNKLAQQIDLLSVTTTLEVGVDIGSLQAIFLANLPPQRFNYQQRVGRAGRRGQMYSYALTFARGRSHDEYHFENPFSITGDKPPQPFLSMDQERIFKRILAKAILRFAFKELGYTDGSVHGEFGTSQVFNQDRLQTVIDDNIMNAIQDIFNSLNVGIYRDGELTPFDFNNFREWILSLPTLIHEKIIEQVVINVDLSELLAESGILPMAGMPTRIRNLIHGFKPISENNQTKGYEVLSINRDIGIAIYEFAPGAQKTKDKGVIQSVGFTPYITKIINEVRRGQAPVFRLEVMQDDAFKQRKWLIQDNNTKVISSEQYDEVTIVEDKERLENENPDCTVFIGATPNAFRTDFSWPKDSSADFDFNLSKPLTFAESTAASDEKNECNYKIRYVPQELTWKINNNGGALFTGKYLIHNKYGVSFENQWISSDFIDQISNVQNQGQEENIALAASKVTEVLRIAPSQLDLGLDINPFDTLDLFKSAASKGAFYSAAFLLQRTLADDLDIDPEEIEIAAIDSIELPAVNGIIGRKTASIVLADELPNGSGFIQQLYQNFFRYLKKCVNPTTYDKYNYSLIQNQECLDASYSDLKNYRNMNFHPLLDWRLGVGLLRIMNDRNYTSGLKADDYEYLELHRWRALTSEIYSFDNFICINSPFIFSINNSGMESCNELIIAAYNASCIQ